MEHERRVVGGLLQRAPEQVFLAPEREHRLFQLYRTRLNSEEDSWIGRREDVLRRVDGSVTLDAFNQQFSAAGIRDGLGGALLNFNQYYTIAPERLWAALLYAAGLGVLTFGAVVVAERIVLRGYRPTEEMP